MFKRSVPFWWITAILVSALPYALPALGGTGIGLCPIQGGEERYVGFDLPIFGLVYAGIGSVLPLLLLVSALATLKASPAMHRILAWLGAGSALIAVAAYALHSALFITYARPTWPGRGSRRCSSSQSPGASSSRTWPGVEACPQMMPEHRL